MECLDVSALKGLVRGLLEETAALSEELASVKKENAELRDEVARLKGLKGRPKLSSPLKKAPLTGFHPTAKHTAAKAISPSSETMRTI